MLNQESFFCSLEATDQLFDIGDTVFRVTLGEVEQATVTESFECTDHVNPFSGKTIRYYSRLLSGGNACFGKYDVGVRFFANEEDALARAALNLAGEDVRTILMDPADADEWAAYRDDGQSRKASHHLYACCARFGNMVYRKGWFTYVFLDEYPDEKKALAAYRKEAECLLGEFSGKPKTYSPAPLETLLIYGRGDGCWAETEYAYNNWYGGLIGQRTGPPSGRR